MSIIGSTDERIGTPRVWARHGQGALVERIAFAYQPANLAVPFLRILPLALDASMLINQATYVVRSGSSGLLLAADLGVLRLYVGETICDEVERNLLHRAASGPFEVVFVLRPALCISPRSRTR